MYGNSETAKNLLISRDMMVYNFASLCDQFPNIMLAPPYEMDLESPDFDDRYANWIFSNNDVFERFIQVVQGSLIGDVYLLVQDEYTSSQLLIESLSKIILRRYSIVSINVRGITDLVSNISYCRSVNTPDTINNMEQDLQRFEELNAKKQLESGGTINVSES